jgi:hypothetical protein
VSPPEKAKGPAANRTPKTATNPNRADDNTLGFWDLAAEGKVRPFVREPRVSHYECHSCRWSL